MSQSLCIDAGLGDLADPAKYQEPIAIEGAAPKALIEHLRTMLVIRRAEEKLADMMIAGAVVCPCHLGIGQEAIAVGVSTYLRKTDRIFGNHRSHTHFLALGGNLESLFAEVLGKATGCSRGMGGSMHLVDEDIGFKGSVPIVAGTVAMAVGASLASALDRPRDRDVGVAFFGDGAIEEGSVHESMNFAGKFNLPMIFVVENNLFSSHLHITQRQPMDSVARFAPVNGLNSEVVDGNDLLAVSAATKRLTDLARDGRGAGFLEAVTYRWRGHVGPSEDNDVGLQRSSDLSIWKKRDPIGRLEKSLLAAGILSEQDMTEMGKSVAAAVETAWRAADEAPYPEREALHEHLWAPTK